MSIPWSLVVGHVRSHWLRTGLTVAGILLGLLLFCMVVSIVTSMDDAVQQSAGNRLVVQSAVSLFVALPLDYQSKIEGVPGVELVSKFQWFGGYYKDPANFFAQFGVDHDVFFDAYARDLEIIDGPAGVEAKAARAAVIQAMAADRRATVIGEGLVRDFGWKVGDTIPIISPLFQKEGGWEFNVVGVYRPLKSNVDDRTIWFRHDYLKEAQFEGTATGPQGIGTYVVNIATGYDPAEVIAGIDGLFANGPQATRTSTEAAFQAGFVSMLGNLPLFIGTIGGAVVFAVFFSVVNTMMMAARQRLREAGILKALGFTDGAVSGMMVAESLALAVIGGALGCLLAASLATPMRAMVGTMIPNFAVSPTTLWMGAALSVLIGLFAGIVPALMMGRVRPTDALRSEG